MKNLNLLTIVIAFFLLTGTTQAQNIAISDVTHTADASAVLDVYSNSLGMLVPRLSSSPSNPANGLLYYSTSSNSFFYNAGSSTSPSWTELSYGSLWTSNGTDTYLSNPNENVFIGGTSNPLGYKFYVQQLGPGLISNESLSQSLGTPVGVKSQISLPCIPSSAVKNRFPSTLVRFSGKLCPVGLIFVTR